MWDDPGVAATIDDQPTAIEVPSPGRRATSWRRRALLAVIVTAALVAAAFFIGRAALAAVDRTRVHVFTDAAALTCENTDVELAAPGDDEPDAPAVPMLAARPGATCTYTFWVENRSGSDIVIEAMRFETLGPGNGFGLTADYLLTGAIEPDADVEFDAVFDTEVALAAGTLQSFTVALRQGREGCNPPGGSASFPRAPIVSVRSRGVSGDVKPTGPTFGVLGSGSLRCAMR